MGFADLPDGSDTQRAAQEALLKDEEPAVIVLDL